MNRLRDKLNHQQSIVIDIDDDDDEEDDGEVADISSDGSASAHRLSTDRDSDGLPHSKKRSLRTSTDC